MKKIVSALASLIIVLPMFASAATTPAKLEVSGWIPYWRTATGTVDAFMHLDQLSEITPFVYTVKNDGTFRDNAHLDQDPWNLLIAMAKAKKVRVIPTIMWANGAAIDNTLSNKKNRLAHVNQIVQLVYSNNYDGIDIDYENKLAETKAGFSAFLKQLHTALGNKWLMCTIESRTPPADQYATIPKTLQYVNDFKVINKYCDRVRIMTYDQMSIDLKLNKLHENELYAPVADPVWVEKAIRVAMKDIDKKKIQIGVATYGYGYDVTAYADGYMYDRLWSFNPLYATQIAAQYGITPQRNAADEISFSYTPTSTPPAPLEATTTILIPGNQVASAALAMASSTNTHSTFRLLWWSDAQAIADKVALAKKLGVRGIAIFKIDGGEDQNLWAALK